MTDQPSSFADDPFGPQLPPGALFIGSTLQQRIDLIEHLLEFGRQIIVLSGPAGSGKSTLLTAIAQAAGQRWTCVHVQGGPALQARAMLAQIADALDVDLSADSEPRMAQTMLKLRLNVLERAGKLTVILVDDADQLPPDAVASLVALARSDDQAAEARVLMAADHDHAGLLANLQRDRPQHGLVHVVEIPPLGEAHTADFIAQRLSAVGLTLADRFGSGDIQRIAAAAAGNPARVVALARQHFASQPSARRDPAAARRRPPAAARSWQLPAFDGRWRIVSLAVLPLLVAGTWWVMRGEGDAPPAEQSLDLELPTQTPPATAAKEVATSPARPPAPPAAPERDVPASAAPAPHSEDETPGPDPRLADGGDRDLIEIVLPDEPVLTSSTPPAEPASPVPPSAAPVSPVTAPPVSEAPAPVAATPPAPPALPAPETRPPPAPTTPPTPPQPPLRPPAPATKPPAPRTSTPPRTPAPTVKTAPAPQPASRVTGFSAEWLLKQPRGSYSLQLAGVKDRASAARFVQRHGLAAETVILDTRRNGQPWYVLVHGYYPTRQAALAAAARLPAAVKKEVQPWARTVGELASLPR